MDKTQCSPWLRDSWLCELHLPSQFFVASKLSPLCSWDTTHPDILVRETNQYHVFGERERLAHVIYGGWQIWNLQGRLAAWRSKEEEMLQVKFEGPLLMNFFLLIGGRSFCSTQAFVNWLRPIHIMENNLHHSNSVNVFFLFLSFFLSFFFLSFVFSGPRPWHVEFPRLGVKLEP